MNDFSVSTEPGAGLERRLRVQVPGTRVDQEVENRLKSVGMTARLKGFRPGKVPTHVLRQRFGVQIRQEVVQDLVQSSYADAIGQQKLRPAGSPRIEMGPAETGQDLVYTAIFEVYPEFRVTGVDGLRIDRPETTVTDDDVNQTIERLRAQRATWSTIQRPAARADRVVIDFNGTHDGQPLPGGKAERVGVVIGENRMLAEFEDNLPGLAAGDEKSFDVSFPPDYFEASLRSARVRFDVRVHEVAERKLPTVDADFIRGFEVASGEEAEFRKLVRENLEREVAKKVQAEVRRQLMDGLLQANPVDVPMVMVNREAANLQAEAMRNMGLQDPKNAPPVNSYEEPARRRVQLSLIISALIGEHGLRVDPARIEHKLDELCQAYDRPEEVRKVYLGNADLMGQIESSVMEEQVMMWLIERATVTPKTVTFAALMGV